MTDDPTPTHTDQCECGYSDPVYKAPELHRPSCRFSTASLTVPSDTVPLNPTALGIIQEFWGAEVDMHPVYGSTSGCSGGIGGSAITEHCAHICTSYKHDKARERYEAAKLALWHLMNGTEPTDV